MGIATPQSGQIAFSDLNTGILNASSTAQLDMNTAAVRLGYGSTSQVSISNLRGATGGTMTIGFRPASKFFGSGYGYDSYLTTVGSISGNIYQPAPANSKVVTMFDDDGDSGVTIIGVLNDDASAPGSGWQALNITRVGLADVQRTINGSPAASEIYAWVSYTMPTSGTISWGLKFG